MMHLSRRDGRALRIGGIVLLGGLLLGRGLPRWLTALERVRAEAALEVRALADARAVIVAAPTLRDSLAQRRARYVSVAPVLIVERNANVAVARLEAAVSGAAANAGIAVSSLGLKADSTSAGILGRPQVRGEARGDVSGLLQFLLLIELGPPFLRVTTLTVTQPDPAGHGGRAEELRIAFVVEGASLLQAPSRVASGRP